MAVTMKNAVSGDFHGGDYEECRFWDVTQCGSCKNGSLGGMYRLNHQGASVASTANVILNELFLPTLVMEAMRSIETSVLTRANGVTSQKTAVFSLQSSLL
jgi:hypothetical protein